MELGTSQTELSGHLGVIREKESRQMGSTKQIEQPANCQYFARRI